MRPRVAIDDELLDEAHRLGKEPTKTATVNEALREYIQRRKRLKMLHSFGTIDFDADYDHKAQRNKR